MVSTWIAETIGAQGRQCSQTPWRYTSRTTQDEVLRYRGPAIWRTFVPRWASSAGCSPAWVFGSAIRAAEPPLAFRWAGAPAFLHREHVGGDKAALDGLLVPELAV